MLTKGTAQIMAEKVLGEEKALRYHKALMAHEVFDFINGPYKVKITPAPPAYVHISDPRMRLFENRQDGGRWAEWDEVSWLVLATLSQDDSTRYILPRKVGMSCYSFWSSTTRKGAPRLTKKSVSK